MKRYGSVFALAARASFTKVVAVTLLAAVLCGVLLWFAPTHDSYNTYDENGQIIATTQYDMVSADTMVKKSYCILPAGLGFVAVILLLARIGTGKGVQPGYTVRRLRVKPLVVTALWSLYNCIMVLFYRGMILLAVYGVIGWRMQESGPQALLLASYGNAFLHKLLPLRDTLGWMMLILTTLLIGTSCALHAAVYWRKTATKGSALGFSIWLAGISMSISAGCGEVLVFSLLGFFVTGFLIYHAFGGDEDEADQ